MLLKLKDMTNLKQIPIAPDYFIDEYGNCYSNKYKELRPLKAFQESSGYKKVTLRIGNKYLGKRIHQLVAITFLPNPNNYNCINHIDADKKNNHVSNLEWCTQLHNIRHSFAMGLVPRKKGTESHMYGEKNKHSKKVIENVTGKIFSCIREAAQYAGVPRTTLNAALTNRRPNNTGFSYVGDNYINPDIYLVGQKITSYMILNTETGIFYSSITDAALAHNMKPRKLRGCITGHNRNKTSFINA